MTPISPVILGQEEHEFLLAKNQPEYFPIPTVVMQPNNTFCSRWKFSDEERDAIRHGADLFYQQIVGDRQFQPISMNLVFPDEINPQTP